MRSRISGVVLVTLVGLLLATSSSSALASASDCEAYSTNPDAYYYGVQEGDLTAIKWVPVRAVIVYDNTGGYEGVAAATTIEKLKEQIQVLNDDFAANHFVGGAPLDRVDPRTADARIRFYLPTDGTVLHDCSAPGHPANHYQQIKDFFTPALPATEGFSRRVDPLKSIFTQIALNTVPTPDPDAEYTIYTVDLAGQAKDSDGGDTFRPIQQNLGLTGLTYFDYRAVGKNDAAADPLNGLYFEGGAATHEAGHFLSLYHTDLNTTACGCSNCATSGDVICDTPCEDRRHTDCDSTYCDGSVIANYMSKVQDGCSEHKIFTLGQIDRMRCLLTNYRSGFDSGPQAPTIGQILDFYGDPFSRLATVSLNGNGDHNDFPAYQTGNGNLSVPPGWTGTISVAAEGVSFSPSSTYYNGSGPITFTALDPSPPASIEVTSPTASDLLDSACATTIWWEANFEATSFDIYVSYADSTGPVLVESGISGAARGWVWEDTDAFDDATFTVEAQFDGNLVSGSSDEIPACPGFAQWPASTYQVGSTMQIRSTAPSCSVQVEYWLSRGSSGGPFEQIGSGLAGDQFYWQVTAPDTTDCFVQIRRGSGCAATSGSFSITAGGGGCPKCPPPVEQAPEVLGRTRLIGVQPNPFNPATEIVFELARNESVRVEIYDVSGRRVREVELGQHPAGIHAWTWNGTSDGGGAVSSGTYLLRLTAGNRQFSEKMLLIK